MLESVFHSMFHLPLPLLEKVLRPIIVYVCLIGFLRLFGKRELAQLNPFDLVVLLSLSNTVQNAIIGEDNSITGGIIGAFSLLAINWIVVRVLYRMPKLNEALEGDETVLICDGKIDRAALERESLTELELLSVIHKQGLDDLSDVEKCVLEPNGTFYVEAKKPSTEETELASLQSAVEALTLEIKQMRAQLASG
ncbi:MAG TPA: YetF domain-containing protein [Acidobacteriaceae bacterium]|nr:YetF domain-containing protein [Acidobacteriaceae bacterium]